MHAKTAAGLNNLAVVARLRGRQEEAEALHRLAVVVAEEAGPPGETGLADVLENFASFLDASGRPAEAEEAERRAWRSARRSRGRRRWRSPRRSPGWRGGGSRRATLPRPRPCSARELEIEQAALGGEHPAVGITLGRLASVSVGLGRHDDAETAARRSLAILDAAGPATSPAVEARLRLADLLRGRGRPDDAVRLCREALERLDAHPDAAPPALRFVALSWLASASARTAGSTRPRTPPASCLTPSTPHLKWTAGRGGWP